MNLSLNKILAVASLCVALQYAQQASAQADSTRSVYNENVVVVGDYNPVLDGVTEKVNVAPAANDGVDSSLQTKFTYSITPRRISSLSSTTGLKAAKVVGSPTRLYNNYLRFGLGHDFAAPLDINPLVDLYYTSTRHDNYAYGARLYHQTDVSSFGKKSDELPSADYYGRNRQSVTDFNVFGKYILNKKHLFSADLSFNREYGRYYGFSDSVLAARMVGMTRDSIKFSDYAFAYNNLALNLGAKSLNTDVNKLGYEANVGLSDMWGRYDMSQLEMDIDASVHYGFPVFSKYKAIAYLRTSWQGFKQRYNPSGELDGLPLGYDPALSLPSEFNEGRHLLQINPFVDFLLNGFKVHAGLAFGFNGYDSPDATSHNLFPDVAISKSFSNNSMSLTLGLKGDYVSNDWNSLRLDNPFIAPAPQSVATVENNLYAKLRINFSKKLILNVEANNRFLQNDRYYCLDKSYMLGNVFKPYFVDVNEAGLAADFTFVNDEMIALTLGGYYHLDYGTPDNVILLHDNDLGIYLDANVNYKDKWLFTLKTLFRSSMDGDYETNPATLLNEVTLTIPAHFGIGLDVEYVHSRALSFFAKFDNITCQRYYYWANYPAPRFNAMVGLTYTIPNQ